MRVSRGDKVIGEYTVAAILRDLKSGRLVETDSYYDEDVSDWLPLSAFLSKRAAPKVEKGVTRPCYCGTGLPFQDCCGDGSQY